MKFEDLGLAEPLLRAVRAQGYPATTKIQAAAIPPVLEGRDVLGCAQTGTGKTAAFALPTLQRLSRAECRVNGRGRKIRTLVLAPTRELALQICESFQVYGRYTAVRQAAIYGGVGQSPQVRALNQGVDVLIATPGRLLDLMQQGYVDLSHVEVLILDEADRMLDMGFIHDLRRIVQKVPRKRQTLLFSATLPPAIRTLADQWLTDPVDVRVTPATVTVDTIRQSVFFVDQKQKLQLLTHWLQETPWTRTLVFTRTKHGADKVAKSLVKAGIEADAFHSNKSQSARQRVSAPLQGAAAVGPGGHRHRRPRAGYRRRLARRELRLADRCGQLHPSHRPHGPGGRGRGGRFVLRSRRAVGLAGDPTSHATNAGRRGAPGGHARRARQGAAFRHENGAGQAGGLGIVTARPWKAIFRPALRGIGPSEKGGRAGTA